MEDTRIETTPENTPYPGFPDLEEARREMIAQKGYNRDTIWESQHREYVRIRHLRDVHLINLIRWTHDHKHRYDDGLREVLLEEARIRKLHPELLNRAYLPYKFDNKWHLSTGNPRMEFDKVVEG